MAREAAVGSTVGLSVLLLSFGFLLPSPGVAAAGQASNFSASQCSIQGTTLTVASQPYNKGDITISKGQSYLVANMNFDMIGSFVVNGGVLIIRNATVKGEYSNWMVGNGGCMEFTSSDYFSQGGIVVGTDNPPSTPDGSRLFVNGGVLMPRLMITGRDEMVNVTDATLEQGVFLASPETYYPMEANSTKVFLSGSLVPTLALAFSGPSQQTQVANLRPGYIGRWDFHQNLSVPQLPYDVSLANVTLIPNAAGPGNILGGGWGLYLSPGGPSQNLWPSLKLVNSQIGYLGLFGFGNQSTQIGDVGGSAPVTETLLGTVSLVNTTMEGLTELDCNSCSLKLDNVEGLAVTVLGASSLSFVNSSITDYLNAVGCVRCTFSFAGASALGNPTTYNFTSLPYYRQLPNASYWSQWAGSEYVVNSTFTVSGSTTVNLVGPDGARPVTYLTWANSTATRLYPVTVTDQQGRGLSNAIVTMASSGGKPVRTFTTDSLGTVQVPITYVESNYSQNVVLSASAGSLSGKVALGYLTGTPVKLLLSQASATSTTASGSTTTSTSQGSQGSRSSSSTTTAGGEQSTAAGSSGGASVPDYMPIEVTLVAVALFSLASLATKKGGPGMRRGPGR